MNRRSFLVNGAKLLALASPAAAALSGKTRQSLFLDEPAATANGFQAAAQLPAVVVPEKMPLPRELPWSIPAQAVEVALLDARDLAQRFGESVGQFLRWVWVQSGSGDELRAVADGLNKVSRASAPAAPAIVGGILARVDLRVYWPRKGDLAEVLGLWEKFAFDPYLSLLFTKAQLALLTHEKLSGLKTQSFRDLHMWQDGAWQPTGKRGWVERQLEKVKDVVVERLNAPHLAHSGIEKLQAFTGSLAPVVHSGYFLTRALSTIKDKDGDKESVFSTIYGGLYYELAGIRKAQAKERTDLDQLFIDLGVDGGKGGYKALFDKLRSDKAAVLIHSAVTGKRRRVRVYPVLSSLFGVVAVTEDIRDRDIDLDADAFRDVVNSKVFAYEVIWVAANGHQKFALFGEQGQLLDEGAAEVVSDHELPRPVTTRLQSAISCIRCHGPHDGWQPFGDDLRDRLRQGTIIFKNADEEDRVRGQHTWDIDGTLTRLRDDYARATLLSTGKWPNSKQQVEVVRLAAAQHAEIWARQRFRQVDAEYALKTLGELPVKDKEAFQLQLLLPPQGHLDQGFIAEDPLLSELKDGKKINWNDWQLLYSYAMTRALQTKARAEK